VTSSDIQQRLEDAEETLRAIRDGEVDALVVRGAESDEVYTIGGDAEAFRTFLEVMEPGAVALNERGAILYANSAFGRLMGIQPDTIQGRLLRDTVQPAFATVVDELLAAGPQDKVTRDLAFEDAEGLRANFSIAAAPLRLGTVSGFAVTFADLSEQFRYEAAKQDERTARAIIASANEAVVVCDRDGTITHANGAAAVLSDGSLIGRSFASAVPLVFPGAAGIMQSDDLVMMAVSGNAVQGIEATATNAPKIKDFLVSAAPLQAAAGGNNGCVVTLVDLSQRKQAERQQLLLMRELDHRVKNTLALVLSISSRTLMSEDTLEGFQRAFTGRIQALAATHTLLAENSWTNLTIRDVVVSELAPYLDSASNRVEYHNLDVPINPRAAIAFGLVIHELATNAAKYGSLSNATGHIAISAPTAEPSAGEPFLIDWQEIGGPAVAEPTRKGFGRTLIARSLQYSPQGGADLVFEPDGVRCRISIPSDDLGAGDAG
jgi:PAS domain S-box-containing protein